MKRIILLFIFGFFLTYNCTNKARNNKVNEVEMHDRKNDLIIKQFKEVETLNDSIFWVYINYYGKTSVDSFESIKFTFEKRSNYLIRYELPVNSKKFVVIDSIFLDRKNLLFKNRIINQNIKELNHIYWDSISEGKVRQLMFFNNSKEIIKKVRIVGNPNTVPSQLFKDVESLIEISLKDLDNTKQVH